MTLRLLGGGGGVSSVSNTDDSLTISPTTGDVIASLNVGNANSWTGQQTFDQDIIFDPGSDTDIDLLTVNVTGTPVLSWNESQDYFKFNKGLYVDGDLFVNGGDITMTLNQVIRTNTTDGSDTQSTALCGGGALGTDRGSSLQLFGNESFLFKGSIVGQLGEDASSTFSILSTASGYIFQFKNDLSADFYGDVGLEDSKSLQLGTGNDISHSWNGIGYTISGISATTLASGDLVMVQDVDDSNYIKTVTAQSIADLVSVHDAVTLAGENYLSLSGQEITANAVNLGSTNITGTLTVSNGGTGLTSVAAGTLLFGSGGASLGSIPIGTAEYSLLSNGATPYWDYPMRLGYVIKSASPTYETGILFVGSGGVLAADTQFVYDDANNFVGINQPSPSRQLDIICGSDSTEGLIVRAASSSQTANLAQFYKNSSNYLQIQDDGALYQKNATARVFHRAYQANQCYQASSGSLDGWYEQYFSYGGGNTVHYQMMKVSSGHTGQIGKINYFNSGTIGTTTNLPSGTICQKWTVREAGAYKDSMIFYDKGNSRILYLEPYDASYSVLTLKGAASQTGSFINVLNSAGTVLAKLTASGYLGIGTTPTIPLRIAGNVGTVAVGIDNDAYYTCYDNAGSTAIGVLKVDTSDNTHINARNGYNLLFTVGANDEKLRIDDSHLYIRRDSAKLMFGVADDASIYYDGTNMCINPKEVGTGTLDIKISASSITTETLSEYITVYINGVAKKLAIVA